MQNSLKKMLARMFADRRRQRRIVAVVCVLSVLVTTTVFTELMQPVITMTPDPVCGQAEHAHGADCFANQLACGVGESEEHAHGDGCYKNVLVCGKSEHAHTEACYPETVEEKKVTVAEPTEAPAVMSVSEEAPAETSATEAPAAEAPETEPTAAPTAEATVEPDAEATAEPTAEATAEPTAEATAEPDAEATVEPDAEATVEPDAEVTVEPTAEATAEPAEALTAAVSAGARSCFAGEEVTFRFVYSGGVEPAAVSIAVRQDGQVLTELTEFAETVTVTPASVGEVVTTVTAEITVTDSAGNAVTDSCEIPCAVRTRENESIWEKSTRVELTGEWPEDLIAVAETQLGYEESEINFIINDEGERQGYTRYGQWYGSSYAEWCAMFASFDLNYAEIPEKYFPREANCEKWISALKSRGLYESAKGDYEPEVGDLVFFDWEDDGRSDHVGIITAVTDRKIETIEGNASKGVRRRSYDRGDEDVCGYGCVLEAYETYLRDELDLDLEAGVGALAIVTAETANLRAEADADSELVAQLTIDTVVDVLAAEQNRAEIWYQVAAGEQTGYIRSDLVGINYIAGEELVPVAADYDSLMARVAGLPFDGSEEHYLAASEIASEADFAYESGTLTDEEYAGIISALTAEYAVMTLEDTEKITVTFWIDDEAYVNDATSGTTHVRIESEELKQLFSDNGMTTVIDAWEGQTGWYKVTSTGIVVQYEIDAGSTLSAAGYATPDLEIYNLSNTEHANTYVSSYSWVSRDADGTATVCSADTAFDADTTLYLQLYSSNTAYYLDFVCCEACNQSISFATSSLYAHPTVQLGSAVSDQYIPKAAAVNSAFVCDSGIEDCESNCRTAENGKVFDHWYLKNTTTGETVEFDSTVQIEEKYLNSSLYGNAIKVYAVWTDAPETVTNLTFMDSDGTTLGTVEETAYNTTIDELIADGKVAAPALTADDCEFIGWTYGDGSVIVDGAHPVTASGTTYQAVYKATVYVRIPDVENGDLNTYTTSEYTVQTGQNLLTAVDADGNSISAILERDAVTNGYVFGGWTLEQGIDNPNTSPDFTTITANAVVTLTAEYSKAITITFRYLPDGETEYVVVETYYVKNGGTIYDMVDENGNSVTVDSVSIPGYTVKEWANANGMPSYTYGKYTQITADIVFTATVTKLPTVTFQYTVTGDDTGAVTTTVATYSVPASGATLAETIAANTGVDVDAAQLPVCPLTSDTQYFKHWATDGAVATLDTAITADTTFEAVFADKALVKFQYSLYSEELQKDTTQTAAECYVIPGEALSTALNELPAVSIAGQRFGGWTETLADGSAVNVDLNTVVAADATEVVYTAVLNTEISINFVYRDVMDSDGDEDTEEVITHAVYTLLSGEPLSAAIRTVTAEDGTETVETLSALPEPPTFENYKFTGWYDSDGQQLTSLEACVDADTNFTGVYEQCEGWTVTFHDIGYDGQDKQPDVTIDVLVPDGEALAGYLPGVSLKDRTADEVIKWYTLDADGVRTEYSPTQPVKSDLDLYTYTYRIVLTLADTAEAEQTASLLDYLMPKAYAATVEVNGNTLTIDIADGEKLTYADFVVDGKDYSLYTWTYTDADGVQQTLDIADLVENGVTSSITATVAATATETSMTVEFYAAINGTWEKVAETGTVYGKAAFPKASGTHDRYYVTLAQIAAAYEKYGFDEFSYAGEKWFPHWSSNGNDNAWGDVYPAQINGYWCIPVGDDAQYTIKVYYSPKQEVTGSIYPDNIFAATNAIYSINAEDENKIVYSSDEALPATQYVLNGASASITLSTTPAQPVEGMTVEWKVYDASGNEVTTGFTKTVNAEAGTVTFSFDSVSQQYILKPTLELGSGMYALTYHINITEELAGVSPVPTINGLTEYTVYIQQTEDGTYTLLYPTELEYSVTGNAALLAREFGGWALTSDATVATYQAGEEVAIGTLTAQDTDADQMIDLYGYWIQQTSHYSVSFYLNLAGNLMTYSAEGEAGGTISGNTGWTDALYSTPLTIEDMPAGFDDWEGGVYPADQTAAVTGQDRNRNSTPDENEQGIVLYDKTGSAVSNVDSSKTTDAVIRSDLLTGVKTVYGDDVEMTFSIGSVPTNNQAIQAAQAKQREYINYFTSTGQAVEDYVKSNKLIYYVDDNGDYQYVPAEEITPDNYTVKWYVLKYEGNGWHIDGALVRKEGKLTITKTFYGDADMIAKAKVGFNITVKNANNTTVHTLEPDDTAKNTFSWTVDVNQGATYTVNENEYFVTSADEKTTSAEYRLTNSSAADAGRWKVYNTSEGVTVTAVAYADNETNYQTVNFLNSYVPENTMIVRKVDAQGNVLTGVEFALTKNDESAQIYTKSDEANVYYLYQPEEDAQLYTGNLKVNSDGVFWIKWPDESQGAVYGDYTLDEVVVPEGYNAVNDITFTISESGVAEKAGFTLDNGVVNATLNGFNLVAIDRPETTNVKVVKKWTGTTDLKAVKLELYRDGALVGTVTLDGKVDGTETNEWEYTWEDMDLYTGNTLAEYIVREAMIGDDMYDTSADTNDGYADYDVVQNRVYYDSTGAQVTNSADYQNIKTVEITVTNAIDMNNVVFTKTDESGAALAGATFTLYDASGKEIATATSGTLGYVVFSNLLPGDYYIMQETGTLAGYQDNDMKYLVNVNGNSFTIKESVEADDGTLTETGDAITSIANKLIPYAAVTVKKVDADGSALDGATFQISGEDGKPYIYTGTTSNFSAYPSTTLADLPAGTYTITETQAPAGYYAMTGTISFTITDGKVTAENLPAGVKFEGDGTADKPYTFTVTNTPGVELPSTGGPGAQLYTIGGLLLMAASLLYGQGQRRKRERGAKG